MQSVLDLRVIKRQCKKIADSELKAEATDLQHSTSNEVRMPLRGLHYIVKSLNCCPSYSIVLLHGAETWVPAKLLFAWQAELLRFC